MQQQYQSHEFFRRNDMPEGPTNRSFGLFFALIFGLVAAYLVYISNLTVAVIVGAAAVVFLALGLKNSLLLTPLNKAWMRFGLLLHMVVNPVVMGAIFFVLLTPVRCGYAAVRLGCPQPKARHLLRDLLDRTLPTRACAGKHEEPILAPPQSAQHETNR